MCRIILEDQNRLIRIETSQKEVKGKDEAFYGSLERE